MSEPRLTASPLGPYTVVRIHGDLSYSHTASDDLSPALAEVLTTAGPTGVILDLSGLEFCDSSGLRLLISAYRRTAASGVPFVMCGVQPKVARLLETTGLDLQFPLSKDLPQARRHLDATATRPGADGV
ncbi:STAS domain-containing protein [Actinocorallia longicatena]|uniref:Anti-sigma factor antagonist n=1 Tax=Actinocorallia longicatena TaxID=111803 RepID=A0ABP6Q6X2_9ACTN